MSILTQRTPGLDRFHAAQAHQGIYRQALLEIRSGVKRNHWMWFVFPKMATSVGGSRMSRHYAIADRAEAAAYLADPVLRLRLYNCTVGVLKHNRLMFRYPDDGKLRASMTLFAQVAEDPTKLNEVLAKFFNGPDRRTLDLLKAQEEGTEDRYWESVRPTFPRPQARTLFEPDRETQEEFDPWTREQVESFVRGCGLSGAAFRLMVGAWMADQDRSYDAGWNAHADANTYNG
jgi:uncharacterized protein (DUF1810 family)